MAHDQCIISALKWCDVCLTWVWIFLDNLKSMRMLNSFSSAAGSCPLHPPGSLWICLAGFWGVETRSSLQRFLTWWFVYWASVRIPGGPEGAAASPQGWNQVQLPGTRRPNVRCDSVLWSEWNHRSVQQEARSSWLQREAWLGPGASAPSPSLHLRAAEHSRPLSQWPAWSEAAHLSASLSRVWISSIGGSFLFGFPSFLFITEHLPGRMADWAIPVHLQQGFWLADGGMSLGYSRAQGGDRTGRAGRQEKGPTGNAPQAFRPACFSLGKPKSPLVAGAGEELLYLKVNHWWHLLSLSIDWVRVGLTDKRFLRIQV